MNTLKDYLAIGVMCVGALALGAIWVILLWMVPILIPFFLFAVISIWAIDRLEKMKSR